MIKKLFFNTLIILILTSSTFASVSLIMQNHYGQNGSQVTVPVKVKDFVDIISAQGTVQFNPAIVSYVSVQQFGLPGMTVSNFGITQVGSGKLVFSWMDGTLSGVTLSDSTVIFSITFMITGTAGQSSVLSFENAPTPIEIVHVSTTVETVIPVNGLVTVTTSVGMDTPEISRPAAGCFPNPFAGSATLAFTMTAPGFACLSVYDLSGRTVWAVRDYFTAGQHSFEWNGSGTNGELLRSGFYYFRVRSDNSTSLAPFVIAR